MLWFGKLNCDLFIRKRERKVAYVCGCYPLFELLKSFCEIDSDRLFDAYLICVCAVRTYACVDDFNCSNFNLATYITMNYHVKSDRVCVHLRCGPSIHPFQNKSLSKSFHLLSMWCVVCSLFSSFFSYSSSSSSSLTPLSSAHKIFCATNVIFCYFIIRYLWFDSSSPISKVF